MEENSCLHQILGIMCKERSVKFHAPEKRLRGNIGAISMHWIAPVAKRSAATTVPDSQMIVDYGPDMVEVGWRK